MYKYLFLILPLLFCGCDQIKFTGSAVVQVEYSEDAKLIASSMSSVSKEDAEVMCMQFSGLAAYLLHTKKITKTSDLVKLITSFQEDYGWTREKYKTYTDAVETFLKKQGYETPKSIVDNVTDNTKEVSFTQVINDMTTLGDAAKLTLEKDNGSK